MLLDIEGTTCPVDFVTKTLFPYARNHLDDFLQRHAETASVRDLINAIDRSYREEIQAARQPSPSERISYLQMLIDRDRKLPALKELQGLIWEEGYAKGEIKAPLFPEVSSVLTTWKASGIALAVYSSGSVRAQQLLYRYSLDGDLRQLFNHWFDTTHGAKSNCESYTSIAQAMGQSAQAVLFLSDSLAEIKAATEAGMAVSISLRGITTLPAIHQDQSQHERAAWPTFTRLSEIELTALDE